MKLPVSFHIENRWKWLEHNSVSIVWLGTQFHKGCDYGFSPEIICIIFTILNFSFECRTRKKLKSLRNEKEES